MNVDRYTLLSVLPPYQGSWVLVERDQDVKDIIKSMLQSHSEFAPYYDRIASFFDASREKQIADNLYNFCKENIEYREESESEQTTALPTGILTRGFGDCKHYAGFCGGVLDAINRTAGKKIKWRYCFASYKLDQKSPYHVFIEIEEKNGGLIWIDPTPGSEGTQPVWVVYKSINTETGNSMALLKNISGFDTAELMQTENTVSGLASSLNVSADTLPLPEGYPSNLPRPYIIDGKLQLTPVPPNFRPDNEQMAYMMLALQLWIYTYSPAPFDIFQNYIITGPSSTVLGAGGTAVVNPYTQKIVNFCLGHQHPDYYYQGQYGHWITAAPSKANGYQGVKTFVPYDPAAGLLSLKSSPDALRAGIISADMDLLEYVPPGGFEGIWGTVATIFVYAADAIAGAILAATGAGAVWKLMLMAARQKAGGEPDLSIEQYRDNIIQTAVNNAGQAADKKKKAILIGGAVLIALILLLSDNKKNSDANR